MGGGWTGDRGVTLARAGRLPLAPPSAHPGAGCGVTPRVPPIRDPRGLGAPGLRVRLVRQVVRGYRDLTHQRVGGGGHVISPEDGAMHAASNCSGVGLSVTRKTNDSVFMTGSPWETTVTAPVEVVSLILTSYAW